MKYLKLSNPPTKEQLELAQIMINTKQVDAIMDTSVSKGDLYRIFGEVVITGKITKLKTK